MKQLSRFTAKNQLDYLQELLRVGKPREPINTEKQKESKSALETDNFLLKNF